MQNQRKQINIIFKVIWRGRWTQGRRLHAPGLIFLCFGVTCWSKIVDPRIDCSVGRPPTPWEAARGAWRPKARKTAETSDNGMRTNLKCSLEGMKKDDQCEKLKSGGTNNDPKIDLEWAFWKQGHTQNGAHIIFLDENMRFGPAGGPSVGTNWRINSLLHVLARQLQSALVYS